MMVAVTCGVEKKVVQKLEATVAQKGLLEDIQKARVELAEEEKKKKRGVSHDRGEAGQVEEEGPSQRKKKATKRKTQPRTSCKGWCPRRRRWFTEKDEEAA